MTNLVGSVGKRGAPFEKSKKIGVGEIGKCWGKRGWGKHGRGKRGWGKWGSVAGGSVVGGSVVEEEERPSKD